VIVSFAAVDGRMTEKPIVIHEKAYMTQFCYNFSSIKEDKRGDLGRVRLLYRGDSSSTAYSKHIRSGNNRLNVILRHQAIKYNVSHLE
jgi:hypothetical protein